MDTSALLIAVPDYDNYPALPDAALAAARLADVFEKGGYEVDRNLLAGGDIQVIKSQLGAWLRGSGGEEVLILFWTGHGSTSPGGYYFACKDSPATALDLDVIKARDLGALLAQSSAEKILLIIDACYSGGAAADILAVYADFKAVSLAVPGKSRCLSIIASAHPLAKAPEAAFANALLDILVDPNAPRHWSDRDELLREDDIVEATQKLLEERGFDVDVDGTHIGRGSQFIRNPRFSRRPAAKDVETERRLTSVLEPGSHFELAARGVEAGESGWYFSGRDRLLRELVGWLRSDSAGIAIVTGPPGSGKSAVVGRLVTLAEPRQRRAATELGLLAQVDERSLPPLESIDVAVHAKGKTLRDIVATIGAALDLKMGSAAEGADITRLVTEIAARRTRVTIALDALDEAAAGEATRIALSLVPALVHQANAKVLVGTRYSLDGAVMPEQEDRHGRLRAAFGSEAVIHDLAEESRAAVDIASYVEARLHDSQHRADVAAMAVVVKRVSEAANGNFLYARVVSRTLQEQDYLDLRLLPKTAIAAFVADLAARFPDDRQRLDDLFRALAWCGGAGLARRVWPQAATALAQGAAYGPDDVAWVLSNAGWHITEELVESDGVAQAVYRLNHQAFVDHYRAGADPASVHGAIAEAISSGFESDSWLDADPYVRRHLADHAAAAGTLDHYLSDAGYLATASPSGLAANFGALSTEEGRRFERVYLRAIDQLAALPPLERLPLLHLTALLSEPDIAHKLRPPAIAKWQCAWARWLSAPPSRWVARGAAAISKYAIAVTADGDALGAVGRHDGSVELWDIARRERLATWYSPAADKFVSAITLDDTALGTVIVAAWCDGRVGSMTLGDPTLRIGPDEADEDAHIISVCAFERDGEALCVTATANHRFATRSLATLAPSHVRKLRDVGAIYGLQRVQLGGKTLIVTASDSVVAPPTIAKPPRRSNSTLRLWTDRLEPVWKDDTGTGDVLQIVEEAELFGARVVILSQDGFGPSSIWDLEKRQRLWRGGQPCSRCWIHRQGDDYLLLEWYLEKVHVRRIVAAPDSDDLRVFVEAPHAGFAVSGGWPSQLFRADGRVLVASNAGDRLRLWDVDDLLADAANASTAARADEAAAVNSLVTGAAFSDRVFANSYSRPIALAAQDGKTLWIDEASSAPFDYSRTLAFADEQLVAAWQNRLALLDPDSGAVDRWLPISTTDVKRLEVRMVDGQLLAFLACQLGRDWAVRIWDLESGEEIPTGEPGLARGERFRFQLSGGEQDKPIGGLAVEEFDGETWIAYASKYSKVTLGSMEALEPAGSWLRDKSARFPNSYNEYVPALAAAHTEHGLLLAAGSESGSLALWNFGMTQPLAFCERAHFGAVTGLAFSDEPGASTLASVGKDGGLCIWDLSLVEQMRFEVDRPLSAVTWTGRQRLYAGGESGVLALDIR